jgi:hypothetical protein
MAGRQGDSRRVHFRAWMVSRTIAEGSLPDEVGNVLSAVGIARPSVKEERRVLDAYREQVESQRPRPTGGQARAIGLLQGARTGGSLAETRDDIRSALAVLARAAAQRASVAARTRLEARARTTALALRETVRGGGTSGVERRRPRPTSGLGVFDPLRARPPASPAFIARLVARALERGAAAAAPPIAHPQHFVEPALLRAVATAKAFAQGAAGRLPKWPAGLLDGAPTDVLERCAASIEESLRAAAGAGGLLSVGHVGRGDAVDAMRALYAHAPIVHMFVELVGMAYASHSHDAAAAP